MRSLVILGSTVMGLSACAARPPIVLPAAATAPTAEARAAWDAATAACRTADTYSAELVIDGRAGAEKLRRVTLQGAMTRDGRIRLLAVAPVGAPIFVLAGRAERATLTLPRQQRVLVAPVADIIDALIGLRFAPSDWVDVLSGCVAAAPSASGGPAGADLVMNIGEGRRALLRQDGTRWRVVAGERPEALIEYQMYAGTWPSLARITSGATAALPIDVRVAIAQIFVNTALNDRAFVADVPPGFTPMTLAELRAIGPLGEAAAGAEPPADTSPAGRSFSSGIP
jgi:hypothetical protein